MKTETIYGHPNEKLSALEIKSLQGLANLPSCDVKRAVDEAVAEFFV